MSRTGERSSADNLRPITPRAARTHDAPRARPARRLRWRLGVGVALVLLVLLATAAGWAALRVRSVQAAYRGIALDVDALQALRDEDPARLSADDLARAQAALDSLALHLDDLDAATQPPFAASMVPRLPWIGPRYVAARQLIHLGRTLTAAGSSAVAIGRETLDAFKATGASAEIPPAEPTWLDVLGAHQADLQAILTQLDQARALRAEIDTSLLPTRVQGRLAELDRLLDRFDIDPRIVSEDLPLLRSALGGDGTVRYLLLFENPSELRLSGGFAGTIALVTIDRGQLRSYEFFDVYDLQEDYAARRTTPVPPPWPVQQYFLHQELPINDANWGADFAADGALLMSMYAETSWPPIDGVIGLTPTVVGDLLRVTGPITADVDGEMRRVTPENVHDEIERQRRLRREGAVPLDIHKEVLALVGAEIIEQLKQSDRGTMIDVARTLKAAADRRDLQFYARDERLQAELDARRWSGRLALDPKTPTLAVNFASTVTTKASDKIEPRISLTFGPPVDGRRSVTMRIDLEHTGDPNDDPFYAGYQRWWVEVALPDGSTRVSSSVEPMPDPASPNGGSYTVELYPQQTTTLTVEFTMPDTGTLLLRRQPGVTPVEISAAVPGCREPFEQTLTQDVQLDLTALCR